MPTSARKLPNPIPTLVPNVSITYDAGKVKKGCISANSRLPKFTTRGD
jgi:hypothetical protein